MSSRDIFGLIAEMDMEELHDFRMRLVAHGAVLEQIDASQEELNRILYTWRWILPWNLIRSQKIINQNGKLIAQARNICPELDLYDA